MSRYEMDWAPYVSVAERRRTAETLATKLRKQGQALAPVVIEGRAIATTFWGKAWCSNLEAYRDYESRLPRGRSYARNRAVIDLQVSSGEVRALVCGSEIYRTSVQIRPLPQPAWRRLCTDCAGRIDSLVELLQGRFSKAVMERLCRQDGGLFPRPSEIRFSCSCPDHASMCKHVAAVLYGVGARLDQQPDVLFRLRVVDGAELAAGAAVDLPLGTSAPAPDRVLQTDDIAALFGLDMAVPAELGGATAKPSVEHPARARRGALAAVPPPVLDAVATTGKGSKPGNPTGGGLAKAGVTAAASGLGTSEPFATAAGAIAIKVGRKTSKAADVVPIAAASARTAKARGDKTAPRAQFAEQTSTPPKAATAGRATPKVSKKAASKAPQAPGTSAAKPLLTVRDRANWSWKARAAARKAKKS